MLARFNRIFCSLILIACYSSQAFSQYPEYDLSWLKKRCKNKSICLKKLPQDCQTTRYFYFLANTIDSIYHSNFDRFKNPRPLQTPKPTVIYRNEYVNHQFGTIHRDQSWEGNIFISPYVTNADYAQFEQYVKDSIIRQALLDHDQDKWGMDVFEGYESSSPPSEYQINWKIKLEKNLTAEEKEIYNSFYTKVSDGKSVFDTSKSVYSYYWIDMKAASKKGRVIISHDSIRDTIFDSYSNNSSRDPRRFIKHELVPTTRQSSSYQPNDNLPVQGLSSTQVQGFINWKTGQINTTLVKNSYPYYISLRLPSFIEADYFDKVNSDRDSNGATPKFRYVMSIHRVYSLFDD